MTYFFLVGVFFAGAFAGAFLAPQGMIQYSFPSLFQRIVAVHTPSNSTNFPAIIFSRISGPVKIQLQ